MPVLIKGMEMPKTCWGCQFGDDCGETVYCNITGESQIADKRHDCPIVEVPTPHGRLIDADALAKTIAEHVYPVADYFNSRDYGMFWTGGIEKAINEQSTIIEAEG